MPIVELGIFDHLIFLILVVFIPWEARHRFRALLAVSPAERPDARVREYRYGMIEEWVLVAIVACGWVVSNRDPSSIGLLPRSTTPALIGYGVATVIILLLLLESRTLSTSDKKRQQARKAIGPTAPLMPHNREERKIFGFVSITAGICEEFLYRGFLLTYLTGVLPGQPTWVIVVLGGVLFGLVHLYQGAIGILKTGFIGVLLGGLYWLTGSIWASMILHAVLDLNSGWIAWRVLQDEDGVSTSNC